jgi:hypothetical protein
MKSIWSIIIGLGLFALLGNLHAQTDSIVQLTAEAQGLELIAPEALPPSGTFWVVSSNGFTAPYPCFPGDSILPVYSIVDGIYLVDDSGGLVNPNLRLNPFQPRATSIESALEILAGSVVDLISQVQETELAQTMARAFGLDVPMPGEGGGEGGGTNEFGAGFTMPDYGTNLWIAQVSVTNGALAGIGTNMEADIQYEIQSRTNLLQTDWQSEGFIFGAELTNWTPLSVAQNARTNLFIRLRSWADDGSGLPLWWQLQYFGTNGVDPYGNPAGDGWSNLQKFQNGWNPNTFYTPPAPQGLAAILHQASNTATVSWLPSPGAVTNYLLSKIDHLTGVTTNRNVSPNEEIFLDDLTGNLPANPADFGPASRITYSLSAQYAGGNSPANSVDLGLSIASSIGVKAFSDQQGNVKLAISGLPDDITGIKFFRSFDNYWGLGTGVLGSDLFGTSLIYTVQIIYPYLPTDPLTNGYFEIPASSITNGVCVVPTNQATLFGRYHFWVQGERANGTHTEWSADYVSDWLVYREPFLDARQQLKDNLRFVLRAANQNTPFQFSVGDDFTDYPFATSWPTNFAYAGYYEAGYYGGVDLDIARPVVENCEFRNFVYDPNHITTNGWLNTGIGYTDFLPNYLRFDTASYITQSPSIYFNINTWLNTPSPSVPASVLDSSQSQYIWPLDYYYGANPTSANQHNLYGLPYLSVNSVRFTNNTVYSTVYSPVGVVTNGFPYYETAQPTFQAAGYRFWIPNNGYYDANSDWHQLDFLPEEDGFSPTNASNNHIVVSVGESVLVAGYARLAVSNGNSGVYGFLGQYFDQAYKIDTNGNLTANPTGILSPYGKFFATEPGPVALVTLPDIDTDARGTCVVYSVSLQLDKNNDGQMNLSFGGMDTTSWGNRMTIWANNNYDRGHTVDGDDFEQDDLSLAQIANLNVPAEQKVPDYQYKTNGLNAIPCTRDLEDYFRLWTPGLRAAMSAMPTNSTVQLLLYGDATIRVFRAVEANGGTNYLFDPVTASNQVANSTSLYVGLLTDGIPIALSSTNEHFIFCGAQRGTAEVHLQILGPNGNVLADSPVYLQIKDIKEMYERFTVGDAPSRTPMLVATNATDGLPYGTPAFQYALPQDTNTPYILFVHGWNMEPWEKDRFAETAYKRLYWQGYQGRFGEFRWPTHNNFGAPFSGSRNTPLNDPRNYDNSESNAWASATGLLNKLNDLNAQYPSHLYLMAHSMGNVVAGEALRLAGSNQVVDTYVAMQAAIPSHTYDANATNRSLGLIDDSATPNRYAHYWTNGAPCYFNYSSGAVTYVNFFNANDWALNADHWQLNQDLKPDFGYSYNGYTGRFFRGTFILDELFFPTNTYELFAYCIEARCYALGAQADVGGAFKANGIYQQVDLAAPPFSFDIQHKYHSGEFRSDNAQRWQYWNEAMFQMGLK